MNVQGSTIVVTGASRGIGKAVAGALARAGGRVALLARSPAIEQVAADLVAQGHVAKGYVVDLGDHRDVDAVAQRITSDLGAPDIVVNNAGAGRWLFVEETPPEEVAAMMAAPYFAAFYVTRAFLPAMLARRAGHIVTINSPVAWLPWPGATGYTAARFAMRGFVEALRLDLRGTGIKVLEVVPGKVSSTYFEHNPHSEERLPAITRLVPTLTPERVAAALLSGIQNDRRRIVIPVMLNVVLLMRAIMPGLVDWMMWRSGMRHELPTR